MKTKYSCELESPNNSKENKLRISWLIFLILFAILLFTISFLKLIDFEYFFIYMAAFPSYLISEFFWETSPDKKIITKTNIRILLPFALLLAIASVLFDSQLLMVPPVFLLLEWLHMIFHK